MSSYGFVRKLDIERAELRLALIVKEYKFASPKFKVPDK